MHTYVLYVYAHSGCALKCVHTYIRECVSLSPQRARLENAKIREQMERQKRIKEQRVCLCIVARTYLPAYIFDVHVLIVLVLFKTYCLFLLMVTHCVASVH